jgi:hypothetical protein
MLRDGRDLVPEEFGVNALVRHYDRDVTEIGIRLNDLNEEVRNVSA